MAIGDVRASGGLKTQLVSDNSGEILARANSGLGGAIDRLAQAGMGYLNSKTDIENIYDRRAQASKGLELDTQLLQYQKDRAVEFAEFSRGRSASPAGMTKDYDETLAKHEAEFLKTVPPRFQEEVKAKLSQDRATRVASAFSSELTLLDTADTNNLNTNLNALGSAIKGGGATLEDAQASWEEMVTKTALPAESKQQFIEQGRATLQGLEFGALVETAAKGFGVVRDGTDGSDVVAAGLSPQDRAVLNAIASNESPAYDIWNGGSKFKGYQDHPAAFGKAPGESTAAGRYQFLLGTWRAASASYEKKYGVKVPDFSPEWQDRVAAHWAENQFNQHYSGASYREILASNDPNKFLIIRDVLGKPRSSNPNNLEWEGLGHMSDAKFIEMMTGEKGFAGGGTGPANMPNPWTDPRFEQLSLENKLGFSNAATAAAEQARLGLASQLASDRQQFLTDAYNAGYSNDPGVLKALEGDRNWDAEAQARYTSGQEVFRASERAVGAVQKSLSEGSPLSTIELKSFGKWFGEDSFAGIVGNDPEAYKKMAWAVEQARLFPEGSSDAFMAAMGNPNTAGNALAFLASAMAGDASILTRSGFNNDTVSEVQLYKNIAERSPTPEAAYNDYRKITETKDTLGMTTTQLVAESYKSFKEAYPTVKDVIDRWDGWISFSPDTVINPSLEGQLMSSAAKAYRDGFMKTGTSEGAEAYMQTALDNTFGVSQTQKAGSYFGPGQLASPDNGTRSVLMQWPPEKYYPAKNADYGYLYSGIADFAENAGAQRNGAVLVPDEQTEREVRANKPPTYMVLGRGELGEAVILPGRFGGEELMKSATESIKQTAAKENSLAFIDEYTSQELRIEQTLELSKNLDAQTALRDGKVTTDAQLEMERQLFEVKQKKHAATISALEQGYLNPQVILDRDDTKTAQENDGQIAKKLAGSLAEQLQNDSALAQRFAQILDGVPKDASPDALTRLIANELRVPKTLAAQIALELMGMK